MEKLLKILIILIVLVPIFAFGKSFMILKIDPKEPSLASEPYIGPEDLPPEEIPPEEIPPEEIPPEEIPPEEIPPEEIPPEEIPPEEEIVGPPIREKGELPSVSTIALETDTLSPLAGQTIEITAKVYSTTETAGMVKFSWFKDDLFLARDSGQGKDKIKFKAGRAGEKYVILVRAEFMNGEIVEKQITIRVVDLDLDWQANTYTLPLSKVKAQATAKALVKVTALPIFKDGSRPEIMHYLWSLNDNVDTEQSGVGKYEFSFIADSRLGFSHEVELIAKNPTESIKVTKRIFIKVVDPEVLIYKIKNGDKNNLEISDSYTVKVNSIIRFRAVPFSFSTTDNFRNLEFEWKLAGKKIETDPENPDIITIKTAEEIPSGIVSAALSVEVKNKANVFQSARETITLNIIK